MKRVFCILLIFSILSISSNAFSENSFSLSPNYKKYYEYLTGTWTKLCDTLKGKERDATLSFSIYNNPNSYNDFSYIDSFTFDNGGCRCNNNYGNFNGLLLEDTIGNMYLLFTDEKGYYLNVGKIVYAPGLLTVFSCVGDTITIYYKEEE